MRLPRELQLPPDRDLDRGLAGRARSAGTHRIRVSSGGLRRARARRRGGGERQRRAAAAVIVQRPFTTALPTDYGGGSSGTSGYACARMRWGRNRMERPPRVGAAVLAKALVGRLHRLPLRRRGRSPARAICSSAARRTPERAPPAPTPSRRSRSRARSSRRSEPGGPRTLLLLGSDRRAKTSTDAKL